VSANNKTQSCWISYAIRIILENLCIMLPGIHKTLLIKIWLISKFKFDNIIENILTLFILWWHFAVLTLHTIYIDIHLLLLIFLWVACVLQIIWFN